MTVGTRRRIKHGGVDDALTKLFDAAFPRVRFLAFLVQNWPFDITIWSMHVSVTDGALKQTCTYTYMQRKEQARAQAKTKQGRSTLFDIDSSTSFDFPDWLIMINPPPIMSWKF